MLSFSTILLRRALHHFRRPSLKGYYSSWEAATAASTGYGLQSILDRVQLAEAKVISGEAAFQRDSVCFDKLAYNWPLLGAILLVATERRQLSVLDIGGGLGSVYRQHASVLNGLVYRWSIVEQPDFVAAGASRFATGPLTFHRSIDEACESMQPDIVLLSSTLQYVQEPGACLARISSFDTAWLVVDRTPFLTTKMRSRISVEHVSPVINDASYPSWVFAWDDVAAWIGRPITAQWKNCEAEGWDYRYEGFIAAPVKQ
jgi:putative methyltransferase (TIGR04325 family)